IVFLLIGMASAGSALQKPTLGLTETPSADKAHQDQQPAAQDEAPHTQEHQPPALEAAPGGKQAPAPGAAEHGEAHVEAHGEGHVQLPEISTIPGVTFVDTLIELMDH